MSASDLPSELETERLLLRRQVTDDAAVYRELWTERDPRVPPHRRIGPDGRPTVEDLAHQILAERDSSQRGLLSIVRKHQGDVIGYCGLLFEGRGSTREPELAYELLQRTHGFGYATEAAQAVVAWAAQNGYQRLVAGVRDWNVASRRVLHKVGFVETGQVERDSTYGDSLITAWTAPGTAR